MLCVGDGWGKKQLCVCQGAPWSWNLGIPFSRPGKSWKIPKVMESYGDDDNVMEFLLLHCKSDTTSFIKSNYEPFYLFNSGTTSRWNCHY